jgi:hypothetical protein
MGRRQRVGIPPLRCTARSKRSQEGCRRWSVPGATCCPSHGGASPQAGRLATVRLSLAELAQTDPRPPRAVLADAILIVDLVQQDALAAVRTGAMTADDGQRLLEIARYSGSIVQLANNVGLSMTGDDGLVSIETATDIASDALAAVVGGLVGLIEVRTPEDVVFAERVEEWARSALRCRLRGTQPPAFPVREVVVSTELVFAGRDPQPGQPQPDVVDVELGGVWWG